VQYYVEKNEYKEGMVEIFDVLAAHFLHRGEKYDVADKEKIKIVDEYLKRSEHINPLNEYTRVIRGFYQLTLGYYFHRMSRLLIFLRGYATRRILIQECLRQIPERQQRQIDPSRQENLLVWGTAWNGISSPCHLLYHPYFFFSFQGALAFKKQKYSSAVDYLTKALHYNSECGANVRVAIATCTFKMQQYNRTRLALDRALAMEVSTLHCTCR
jgi:tetratricopeptide (TPR) repeat protein